jgi:putative flippase GtrA
MAINATIRSIGDAWRFYREHGLWKAMHSKDAPWIIQFGKYGLCGAAALVVHNAIVIWLSHTSFLPAVESLVDDRDIRARNQFINNLIAFPFGTLAAYTTNALWVFTGGRHSRRREFIYFTVIGLASFLAGLAAGPLLVKLFGVPFTVAQLGFVVSSALVNFLARKFFVFKS